MEDITKILKDANFKLEEVDFTNKESVDKYINTVKSIKDKYNELKKTTLGGYIDTLFSGVLFDIDVNEICDKLINTANEHYEESKIKVDTVSRPSSKVNEKVLRRVSDLATEYVSEIIEPNTKLSNEQKKSVYECLIEFACWMYSHE